MTRQEALHQPSAINHQPSAISHPAWTRPNPSLQPSLWFLLLAAMTAGWALALAEEEHPPPPVAIVTPSASHSPQSAIRTPKSEITEQSAILKRPEPSHRTALPSPKSWWVGPTGVALVILAAGGLSWAARSWRPLPG